VNTYSETFKAQMVKKMLPPAGMSAHALAAETGLNQSSLSRWLRNARSVGVMNQPAKQWTAAEKFRVVVESAQLDDAGLGTFLRREGLHKAELDAWKAAIDGALSPRTSSSPSSKRKSSLESKRIAALERELRRKDKALAEAAALLMLQKKAQELWGDAADVMNARSEK
jgi:transposase-like protein